VGVPVRVRARVVLIVQVGANLIHQIHVQMRR